MGTIPRILYADDEEQLRVHLGREFTAEGYFVVLAENGEKALALLKGGQFDLAILDIVMPRMNGIDVLKFIKREFPSTKVLMLTGYTNLQHALESKRFGADEFMGKPFDLDELKQTVKRLLFQSRE